MVATSEETKDEGLSKEELEEEKKDTITDLEAPKPKPSFPKKSLSLDIDESN